MKKLKVVNGEISYLSDEDDQTYGMWCPVSYDTYHGLKDGTVFVIENNLKALHERIAELQDLCKECADYIDINRCSNIGYGSILHKKLREQAKGGDYD